MTRKRTTSKTTTSKAAKTTASSASEKPAPVATEKLHEANPTEAPVEGVDGADAPVLKKPEFIDRVVERSGGKKKDVKPAVETALAILGEAIVAGEEINLPPLGKLKVVRTKEAPNADVLTFRLRRSHNMVEAQSADEASDEKTS